MWQEWCWGVGGCCLGLILRLLNSLLVNLPAARPVQGMVSGLFQVVGIPTGHMSPQCTVAYLECTVAIGNPNSIFRLANHMVEHTSQWEALSHTLLAVPKPSSYMMTSANGNIFRVTGHLCGEFTGPWWIPRTKASDAELWRFLWYTPE